MKTERSHSRKTAEEKLVEAVSEMSIEQATTALNILVAMKKKGVTLLAGTVLPKGKESHDKQQGDSAEQIAARIESMPSRGA